MADHIFHGTVVADQATGSTHLMRKDQVDTAVASALNRANHTGTQLMSTISDAATYVDGRISTVLDVGGAPAALNTLNELAAALGDDPNYAATVTAALGSLDTRVDTLEASGGSASYKATVGDGALAVFTLTHNLGTLDVDVIVRRVSDGQRVFPVDKAASVNTVTVDFGATVPALNTYRVIITAH